MISNKWRRKIFYWYKDKVNVIFDVGCLESEFINFKGEVHYFDHVNDFIENLKNQKNTNKKSYFNNFGLGNENNEFIIILSINRFMIELIVVEWVMILIKFYYIFKKEKIMLLIKIFKL